MKPGSAARIARCVVRHDHGRGLMLRRASGSVVKIDPAALEQMLRFQQLEAHQAEAGGVLLGRRILGGHDVVVDEVTSPMPEDVRTRQTFHRSRAGHQQVIGDRWRTSEGTCLYLGEWHTHPEPCPLPSQVDVGDWRRRLRTDRFDEDSLLFVIVGMQEVRAWEGFRHSLEILPLVGR